MCISNVHISSPFRAPACSAIHTTARLLGIFALATTAFDFRLMAPASQRPCTKQSEYRNATSNLVSTTYYLLPTVY